MSYLDQTQPNELAPTADEAWAALLCHLLTHGRPVAPRGQQTVELLHHVSLTVDLNHPIITCPTRKLNYRFMAAEALWIAAGRDDLAWLAEVNPRMSQFSDDGETLAGAYGPRIRPQTSYVVNQLIHDRDTRQAALTIWTPNPRPSKDIPCTIAMVFSIRGDKLFQHVFMRSSDAWLGIPYDVFSFSFLAMEIACRHNSAAKVPVGLGHLTITCTSSHLYERDREAAAEVLNNWTEPELVPTVNEDDIARGRFMDLVNRVHACATRQPGGSPRYPL